jgi:drug/metabolite transporter (DMT)-like permease
MAAVLLGVFAALCWSLHDLVARSYAERIGPFRMAAVVMVAGAAMLLGIVLWRGTIWTASTEGLT